MSKRDGSEVSSNAAKVKAASKEGPPSRKPGLPEDLDLLMKDTALSLMIKFGEPSIARTVIQGLREVTENIVLAKISEAEATLSSAATRLSLDGAETPDSSQHSTKLLLRILGYMNYYQQCPKIQQAAVQALSNISLNWTNRLKMAFVRGNGISILLQAMSVFSNSEEYCIIFSRLGITADSLWNLQLFNRLLDERVLSTMIRLLPFADEESCELGKELTRTMSMWSRDGDIHGNISITRERQDQMLEIPRMWLNTRLRVFTLTRRIGSFVQQIEDSGHNMRLELLAIFLMGRQVDMLLPNLRRLCSDLPGNEESTVQVSSDLAEREYQELMERCDVAQNQGGNET